MKIDVESFPEAVWEILRRELVDNLVIAPRLIILSKQGAVLKNPSGYQTPEEARRDIRLHVTKYNAWMVVIISLARIGYKDSSHPGTAAVRPTAISVYCETANDRVLIVQEFEIDSGGNVIFGELAKLNNLPPGSLADLSGFFTREA
jgi:hypothetical protein